MAGFLTAGTPVFEIRDVAGHDSNMLVDDPKRGKALVATLGDKPIVLMRGHGNTVVAGNIRQATFRAIYTEIAAQLQLQAMAIAGGKPVNYLTPEEGEAIGGRSTGGGTNRAWALWESEITGG
jgi:HCOMODA/2-hydroxy-3-carboxy-muconic semialdehyde decarboxylase